MCNEKLYVMKGGGGGAQKDRRYFVHYLGDLCSAVVLAVEFHPLRYSVFCS